MAPAIVWQDLRTAEICDELAREGGQDRFRDRTGLPLATYFSGPKLRWLLDHVPGARDRATQGDLVGAPAVLEALRAERFRERGGHDPAAELDAVGAVDAGGDGGEALHHGHSGGLDGHDRGAKVKHPKVGDYVMSGWPVRFGGTPPEVGPAPLLGQHSGEVLADWLGRTRQ